MKDIRVAREQWRTLLSAISSFEVLQTASLSDANLTHGLGQDSLRSILWKTLLLCHKLDISILVSSLRKERAAYEGHKQKLLSGPGDLEDGSKMSRSDPLADDESSPWVTLRADEELRDEIQKDIGRTYPDTEFFRADHVQSSLSNILFIWSRLHPETSYRQGMHELAAPLYWVVHSDALTKLDAKMSKTDTNDNAVSDTTFDATDAMKELLDPNFIEHDTFSIFQKIMLFAKSWYELGKETTAADNLANSTPIILKSEYIHQELLGTVDPELADHLNRLGILPQIFLIRWIRLMFGREFNFAETLGLWDGIFVEDPTLQIVDYVSVAMLLRVRWKLLNADYSTAISLLLRYESSDRSPPLTFLQDAIQLRDDLSRMSASKIIFLRTGRAPEQEYESHRAQRRKINTGSNSSGSPILSGVERISNLNLNNIEALMHNVASSVRDRSERWGVNQAIRDAIGEVKRMPNMNLEQQRRTTTNQQNLGEILSRSIVVFDRLLLEHGDILVDTKGEEYRTALRNVKDVRDCLVKPVQQPVGFSAGSPQKSKPSILQPSIRPREVSSGDFVNQDPKSPALEESISIKSVPPPFPTYSEPVLSSLEVRTPGLPEGKAKSTPRSPQGADNGRVVKGALPSFVPQFGTARPRPSIAGSQFAWMLGEEDKKDPSVSFLSPGSASTLGAGRAKRNAGSLSSINGNSVVRHGSAPVLRYNDAGGRKSRSVDFGLLDTSEDTESRKADSTPGKAR